MTDWAEALDAFEERLRVYRSVLERNAEPSVRTWPPEDLHDGGIPDELVPRARALLAEALELESELSTARAAIHTPLRQARRRRTVPGRPSIWADL